MNTPTPVPSWPTRMAAIFNEWALRYSESPDSFCDVLGPDGKPVEDYGQRCATYFEQISRELYPSVKYTNPTQALANAALDWCEERVPRDRGDAELLKAMWNYSGDYVGPCAGCDGSCDEACAQSLTVAQAHAAIDRALEAHRAKIADEDERRSQRIQRLAQQAKRQQDELLRFRIQTYILQEQLKRSAAHFINGEPTRAEMPTGLLNATRPDDPWPYDATVKLIWVGSGPGLGKTIGWAKRDENGNLVSTYSLSPLDAECWEVIEERTQATEAGG